MTHTTTRFAFRGKSEETGPMASLGKGAHTQGMLRVLSVRAGAAAASGAGAADAGAGAGAADADAHESIGARVHRVVHTARRLELAEPGG